MDDYELWFQFRELSVIPTAVMTGLPLFYRGNVETGFCFDSGSGGNGDTTLCAGRVMEDLILAHAALDRFHKIKSFLFLKRTSREVQSTSNYRRSTSIVTLTRMRPGRPDF